VPSVAGSRFDGLPKAVDAAVLGALLASCDRSRPSGQRDFAILVLMSRLGLRAADIAALRLDDIDWRAGELELRGKGGRRDRLPLPGDVGEVLVEYLRFGRRPSTDRAVFLQARQPAVGMSRNAVVFVSRRASARAGLAVVGGHRLRHTAATEMLRHGASLREVGQVLRHNDDTTTAIYAKVDRASLSLVVRPWPAEAGR
jgi:integrase/recombinase XerD